MQIFIESHSLLLFFCPVQDFQNLEKTSDANIRDKMSGSIFFYDFYPTEILENMPAKN